MSSPLRLIRRALYRPLAQGALALAAMQVSTCLLLAAEVPSSPLAWPQLTSEARPWTRWWWMGSILTKEDLTAEMEKYAAAGLGGLEITPIYGVRGYEDRFIDYLTPQWVEMLVHTLKEADRLGLGIDMATGNGWPFGGPWVGPQDACKNAVCITYTLKAGQRLQPPVSYVQSPLVRAIGRRVDVSELKEPIGANQDLQTLALEQVRFPKPLPLQVLMAYSDQGQTLDLTGRVDADGRLDWTAAAGNWTLYAVFQGWHGKMVERAGPGGEGNVIDHFSSAALRNYLSKFDQALAGHDLSSLRAWFNDSYEVDDASGESNWTTDLFEQFRRRRGYELRDHLPALFAASPAEESSRVRCDYRETISDLLLEEFTIPWREWAEGRGATTRNQAHGAPANLLDLYAASGIPETEGSNLLGMKLASSAAHVTGKRLASAETATWLAEHFFATLGTVKPALDRFFLGEINHVCYHGTTFSPPWEDWPGWMFYASVHFGPTNSFWPHFPALNAYVARCQSLLQAGQPDNDVLLYYPIHDTWSQPGRGATLPHFTAGSPGTAANDGQVLWRSGHTFDFISDRQLAAVQPRSGLLQTGGVTYKAVVVPQCQLMPLDSFEKLVTLADAGATVIFRGRLPSDVPGWGSLDRRQARQRDLLARVKFTEADESGVQTAAIGSGRFLLGSDLGRLLARAGIQPEPMVGQGLQFVRRQYDGGRCYFLVNTADGPLDGWVPIRTDARSVAIFDPMSGQVGLAAVRTPARAGTDVYLQLAPGQSCILKTFGTPLDGPAFEYVSTSGEPQEIRGTWTLSFIEGGPELPPNVQVPKLGSWTNSGGEATGRFSGMGRYSISFQKPEGDPDRWLLDLGRVCETARVRLNGKDLGTLIGPRFHVQVPGDSLREDNVLEIEVANSMLNRIADLDRRGVNWKKFYNTNFPSQGRETRGANGQFDASRLSPRDSGLIGPVTLTPLQLIDPNADPGGSQP